MKVDPGLSIPKFGNPSSKLWQAAGKRVGKGKLFLHIVIKEYCVHIMQAVSDE